MEWWEGDAVTRHRKWQKLMLEVEMCARACVSKSAKSEQQFARHSFAARL